MSIAETSGRVFEELTAVEATKSWKISCFAVSCCEHICGWSPASDNSAPGTSGQASLMRQPRSTNPTCAKSSKRIERRCAEKCKTPTLGLLAVNSEIRLQEGAESFHDHTTPLHGTLKLSLAPVLGVTTFLAPSSEKYWKLS